jgi:hypothetical protein
LNELTPQNYRAFNAVVSLLAELLGASGNDGDRGALTVSFAEALIAGENPPDYVMLFDRLVDDYEWLFDEEASKQSLAPINDSLRSKQSANANSISSGASSLRKRFGLGFGTLPRDNSKADGDSNITNIWRSLSKKASGDGESQPASLSRSFLSRSRSKDKMDRKTHSRPGSQDQPPSTGSSQPEARSRPGSAHNTLSNLSSIGEVPKPENIVPRKKRRSSLSDLQDLHISGANTFDYTPGRASPGKLPFPADRAAAKMPNTPTRTVGHGGLASSSDSPINRASPSMIPQRTLTERAVNRTGDVTIHSFSAKKREGLPSTLPVPDRGLQERTSAGPNKGLYSPSKAVPDRGRQDRTSPGPNQALRTSPGPNLALGPRKGHIPGQRLKIQSPQKLKERLQQEKEAMNTAGPVLQAELSKIGDELAAANLARTGSKTRAHPDFAVIHSKLKSTQETFGTALSTYAARLTSLTHDVESTVVVNERKARELDKLYSEANMENEMLYDRFNTELAKTSNGVRAGNGVEELKKRLEEAQDELARVNKENQRLKREVLGLRCS